MALRAGYYGLKNSVKKKLEKLAVDTSGMKIIKSFGDGLNLTQAGKLNMTAATASKIGGVKVGSGLAIDDGVLSTDGTGLIDYSTTEQDTGVKWTDGKTIYRKTYNIGDATGTKQLIDTLTNLGTVIDMYGAWNYQLSQQNEIRPLPHFASSSTMVYPIIDKADSNKLYMIIGTAANTKGMWLTIEYTKTEQEE